MTRRGRTGLGLAAGLLPVLTAPVQGQPIADVPRAPPERERSSFTLAYVEAPREIALGTMAVNVWAQVEGRGSAVTGVTLAWKEARGEKRIEMVPLDGVFDSHSEEVVGTVDTYAWVRDAAHEFEIRVRGETSPPEVAGRGAIRVKPRISTPDLVLVDERGTAQPWIGSGAGGFTRGGGLETGTPRGRPALLDVDGNRLADLLLPSESGRIHVYANRGRGRLEIADTIECGPDLVDAVAGDLDGNGQPDLVTASSGRALDIRLDLAPDPAQSSLLTLVPDRLALADLDGDGFPEICLALLGLRDGEVQVWTRQKGRSPSWVPTARLAAPQGGRGRIRDLAVLPGPGGRERLLVLSSREGEGMLESWEAPADTKLEPEPVCRARHRLPGEPVRVVTGRFGGAPTRSWLAVVRTDRGATLLGLREGRGVGCVGSLEPFPDAICVLDLDGDGDDDLVTGGEDLRLWINIRGEDFREAGESPYLLEAGVVALVSGSLDEPRR